MSDMQTKTEFVEPTWFADDPQAKFEKYLMPMADWFETYLEIGVCCGGSMMWVMDNLKPRCAVGVDRWYDPKRKKQEVLNQYKKASEKNLKQYGSDIEIRHMESKEYLATTASRFDLVYADGDHSGNGAMRDWLLAYEILTPARGSGHWMELDGHRREVGGVLVVDDLNRLANHGKLEVRPAWDLFLTLMHGRVRRIWEDGRQGACIRID